MNQGHIDTVHQTYSRFKRLSMRPQTYSRDVSEQPLHKPLSKEHKRKKSHQPCELRSIWHSGVQQRIYPYMKEQT